MLNIFKPFIFIVVTYLFIVSCGNNETETTTNEIDFLKKSNSDKELINNFLLTHYYEKKSDSIKLIQEGDTTKKPLSKQIKKQTITNDGIDHELFFYVTQEGKPKIDEKNPNYNNPTLVDSVFVNYQRITIVKPDSLIVSETNKNIWFDLSSNIIGWRYGLPKFKPGVNTTQKGEPISYKDFGKGFLIIPSGLAYYNKSSNINKSNFLFKIELLDFVKFTDTDNDGVPSIKEDIDGDSNPFNDDTDSDGRPNYRDTDDDGDGVLTRNEDKNGDGDPTNDFNDPNNQKTPDYLNFKAR